MKVGDEGLKMSDLDLRKLVYLFLLCTTIFPNLYYSVNPKHFSIVEDLNTFEVYA